MSRRRTPFLHRWSRPAIGAIATLGAILTAYLTITKLTGADVGCVAGAEAAVSNCTSVLDSRYATVFGLPLSLFGCLGYLAMGTFALSPLAINRDQQKSLRRTLEDWTWLFLLIGATAMTVFSGYLMYLLTVEIQAVCLYCIGSALFATSMLLLTIFGRDWDDVGQILFTGIIVAMITLIATLAIYSEKTVAADGQITIPQATTAPVPPEGWAITTTSTDAEIQLAEHLTEIGAVKYGAFWCPHCYDQKLLFGKEAFSKINYVECDPQGKNPQPNACTEAGVQSYPTWEINGEIYRGTQTLEELAEASGYTGPTDFKYQLPNR
jgi:uncharacterized membrane protein